MNREETIYLEILELIEKEVEKEVEKEEALNNEEIMLDEDVVDI